MKTFLTTCLMVALVQVPIQWTRADHAERRMKDYRKIAFDAVDKIEQLRRDIEMQQSTIESQRTAIQHLMNR